MGKRIRLTPTTIFVQRCLAGLNQTELAARIGVGQADISQLENLAIPAFGDLQQRYAKVFKKTVSELFDERGFAKLHSSY